MNLWRKSFAYNNFWLEVGFTFPSLLFLLVRSMFPLLNRRQICIQAKCTSSEWNCKAWQIECTVILWSTHHSLSWFTFSSISCSIFILLFILIGRIQEIFCSKEWIDGMSLEKNKFAIHDSTYISSPPPTIHWCQIPIHHPSSIPVETYRQPEENCNLSSHQCERATQLDDTTLNNANFK